MKDCPECGGSTVVEIDEVAADCPLCGCWCCSSRGPAEDALLCQECLDAECWGPIAKNTPVQTDTASLTLVSWHARRPTCKAGA